MATHDIARETWADFFDDLSRRRQGSPVTVETVAPESGTEREVDALPFAGISLDTKGSGAGAIVIILGTETDDHVTHTITNPTRVYHKTGGGVMSIEVEQAEALEITSSDEPPITYLRFHLPEEGG